MYIAPDVDEVVAVARSLGIGLAFRWCRRRGHLPLAWPATRLAGLLAWLMLTGIDNRNPLVIDGGDDFLRMLLFWGLFLPLGARWWIDARSLPPAHSARLVSMGTFAFLLQLALLYSVSAYLKSYREWVTDGRPCTTLSISNSSSPRSAGGHG